MPCVGGRDISRGGTEDSVRLTSVRGGRCSFVYGGWVCCGGHGWPG